MKRSSCSIPGSLYSLTYGFVLLLAGCGSSVYASMPSTCQINFTSPLFIPVNGSLGDIVIDLACEKVYVTNTTNNRVEVFSVQSGALTTPIAVGSAPAGLDFTPDGNTLYVANSGGNNISVVDLSQGIETRKINVPAGFSNDKPYSIAISNNGLALFSTTFAGSGFGARMLELNLATDTINQRTDFWFGGTTTERTYLRSSADKSTIAITAGNISSGPVFFYKASNNTFSPEKDLNSFVSRIATNATGSAFLAAPGVFVLDGNLNLSGTIAGGGFGAAVDPAGTVGYSTGASGIDVFDLSSLLKTDTLPIGDSVDTAALYNVVGSMGISNDGKLLAVITDHGFSLVRTESSTFTSFANLSANATISLKPSDTDDTFFARGSFTLGDASNGIDILNEEVSIQIGAFSVKIPSGSFVQKGPTTYTYRGVINGHVALAATIHQMSQGVFRFKVRGNGVELTGSVLPLNVNLMIGDDSGNRSLVKGIAKLTSIAK